MTDRDDELNLFLRQLVPSSLWNVAPVVDEPQLRLMLWSIREDQAGNRYFVGTRTDDETGRVSTRIVEFDIQSRRGRTASGRVYELVGPPGASPNAEYVWSNYKRTYGIIESERPDEQADGIVV